MSEERDLGAVQRELGSLGFDVAEASLSHLPEGRVNDNFRLMVDADEAILRVWKLASHEQATAELALLRHLGAAGIRCPRPSSFQPAEPLTVLEHPAAFFEVIPGGPHKPKSWDAHVNVSHELARVLAGVHIAGASVAHLPYRQLPHSARLVEYAHAARAVDFGALHQRCMEIVDRIESLSHDVDALASEHQLVYGLIHGDPGSWNVIVNDESVHLLDFDMAHRDLLCYDVGQLVSQWGATNESASNPARLWDPATSRALVNAYAEVRPLSEVERRAVALCVPLRQALDVLGHLPAFLSPEAPFPLEEGLESFAILGLADDPGWTDAFGG